jgi:hypothetical protein
MTFHNTAGENEVWNLKEKIIIGEQTVNNMMLGYYDIVLNIL